MIWDGICLLFPEHPILPLLGVHTLWPAKVSDFDYGFWIIGVDGFVLGCDMNDNQYFPELYSFDIFPQYNFAVCVVFSFVTLMKKHPCIHVTSTQNTNILYNTTNNDLKNNICLMR